MLPARAKIIVVNDKMQKNYRYKLTAPVGKGFHPVFKPDRAEKIEFVLLVKPEELRRLPKIKFSADGLTVLEVLWIACNRASLEYRITGTTVYIDKKNVG